MLLLGRARLVCVDCGRILVIVKKPPEDDDRDLSPRPSQAERSHATQAARKASRSGTLPRTTRHRSVEVLRRYVREASVFRSNSSARLGL